MYVFANFQFNHLQGSMKYSGLNDCKAEARVPFTFDMKNDEGYLDTYKAVLCIGTDEDQENQISRPVSIFSGIAMNDDVFMDLALVMDNTEYVYHEVESIRAGIVRYTEMTSKLIQEKRARL